MKDYCSFLANLLRDRMLQLRNRFNLEKRKMESMRENNQTPISTWPLFEYMTFLEGHIRPRKSYKMLMKEMIQRQNGDYGDSTRGGFDSDERSDDDGHLSYNQNGKHEYSDDNPTIDESNVSQFMVPEMTESSLPPPPPMSIKRQRLNDDSMISSYHPGSYSNFLMQSGETIPKLDKYNKFGQFIASSLADLQEEQALSLIEKFTLDIVASMRNNLTN